MVRKKHPLPNVGELVMGTIVEVNPSHLYLVLDDYVGMETDKLKHDSFNISEELRYNCLAYMHISEIANHWIKNIRDFVKEGQKIVVKVQKVDTRKGHVDVSKRRVSQHEQKEMMKALKLSNKAEGLLRLVGDHVGATLDEMYDKVGFYLDDEYGGNLWSAFEDIKEQGIDAIMDLEFVKHVPEAWLKELEKVVDQNVEIHTVKIVGEFELISYAPNGVDIIKEAVEAGMSVKSTKEEPVTMHFQLIAPPRYRIDLEAGDFQVAEQFLKKVETKVTKVMKKADGYIAFKR